jgi:sterol desaturase/sphingolipid hydroxylase (fatty acid hydroxylase superfamily)
MSTTALIPIVALIALIVVELSWSLLRRRPVYNAGETLANLAIAVGNGLTRPAAIAWSYLVMSSIEPARMLSLPETLLVFVLTFVVVDLAYYGYHRASHELRWLWAMHHTHHSSPWYNFSTAVRLSWLAKFITPLYFAPLVLIGLPAEFVVASLALGLLYQLFLHTEAIPALGRFEGLLLNTPSAHRVHHGSNTQYIDRNYAGVLIVWDRLFGTYEPEGERVRYGVTTGFLGHNPLMIQFAPLWKYLRGGFRREAEPDRNPDVSEQALDSGSPSGMKPTAR